MKLTKAQEDRVVDLLRRGNAVLIDKTVSIAPKGRFIERVVESPPED